MAPPAGGLHKNLWLNFTRPLSGQSCSMRPPGGILSWPLPNPTRLKFFIAQPAVSYQAASHLLQLISYYWRPIFLPSRSLFPIRLYLLSRACSTSTLTALPLAHTGIEPCQKASQMSFLALPLSGAGFTTHLGPKKTADSVSPDWDSPHYTVSTIIECCSRSCSTCHESAKSHLGSLLPTYVQVWTDGSVLSTFRPGGAGVHIICKSCSTSLSLPALCVLALRQSLLLWNMA